MGNIVEEVELIMGFIDHPPASQPTFQKPKSFLNHSPKHRYPNPIPQPNTNLSIMKKPKSLKKTTLDHGKVIFTQNPVTTVYLHRLDSWGQLIRLHRVNLLVSDHFILDPLPLDHGDFIHEQSGLNDSTRTR